MAANPELPLPMNQAVVAAHPTPLVPAPALLSRAAAE